MRVVTIVNAFTGALFIQELLEQGDEVVAVVTPPGDPRPGADPATSPKLVADRLLLPVYQPQLGQINTPPFAALLKRLQPDLILTVHYPVIFKRPILEIPPLGVIGQHPSRLPAGRGMTPSFWHMIIGDPQAWMSTFWIDPGIDRGDVLNQGSVDVTPEDTGVTISAKLSHVGRLLLRDALPLIREGKAPRIPQSQIQGVKSSYVSWKPEHCRIDWSQPAPRVALFVRTLTRPGESATGSGPAYTHLAGHKIRVRRAVVDEQSSPPTGALPGQVLGLAGQGLRVQTGDGAVVVTEAEVAGREGVGLDGVLVLFSTGLTAVFQ